MRHLHRYLLLVAAVGAMQTTTAHESNDPLPDAVVRISAVREFQGLFEWAPGPWGFVPDQVLGGHWNSSGTVIDMNGVARRLGVRPAVPIRRSDVYVVTSLRSVHVADEVWVRAASPADRGLDVLIEVPGEVIASDAALNLALVLARQPERGPKFPTGVLLSEDPIVRGHQVVRFHRTAWRSYQRRDELWTRGVPTPSRDPFRLETLPTWFTHGGVKFIEVGGPLLDPQTGRLIGILGNTQRKVKADNKQWKGDTHLIEADQIAGFLRSALAGEKPRHGDLVDGGPSNRRIDPSLAALLGLPSVKGLYALADWPEDEPIVRRGDVLLRVGRETLGVGGVLLSESVFDLEPGTNARLELLRGGETRIVDLPVVELERPTGRETAWMTYSGAWIQDVPPVMYLEGYTRSGPVVVHVDSGSPAEAGELGSGMVIHDVLGAGRRLPVENVADLVDALRAVVEDREFDGELGLRVSGLRTPGSSVRVVLLRTEAGAIIEEGAR